MDVSNRLQQGKEAVVLVVEVVLVVVPAAAAAVSHIIQRRSRMTDYDIRSSDKLALPFHPGTD